MWPRRAAWVGAVWIALLGAWLGEGAKAEPGGDVTMQVTPRAARVLVAQAISRGNPELAVRIARQVLAANPNDIEAQVLLAAALSRSGQTALAETTGKRAFRATKDRPWKFQAAFLTAEALASQDRLIAAKWWLRRADSYRTAPTDMDLLRRGFATLEQRMPLKFSVSLAAGPSNNVNGGSLHESFDFYGIPIPIEQALPGYTAVAAGTLSYRLQNNATSTVNGFVKLRRREVWLSHKARKLQPLANASDYSNNGLDLGISGQVRTSQTLGLTYAAQVGRQWYSFGRQSEVQRLQFGLAKLISPQQVARLDLTAEAVQSPATPRNNSVRLAAEASLGMALGKGRLTGIIGLSQLDAAAPGLPYRGISLGLEAQPADLVQGLDLQFFASVEAKDYWKAQLDNPDLVLEAGATASFSNMSLLGFRPTATVSATRSVSDLVIRDSMNLGLSVGIRSSF
ncbi:tetratricopeptide repeat protein [Cypionkella aquatica]|uniref:tetratricopeptide repeat protein n=1 Tax=Cypionkella aquatica TaxID=1756042 RepID=UPI0032AF5E19